MAWQNLADEISEEFELAQSGVPDLHTQMEHFRAYRQLFYKSRYMLERSFRLHVAKALYRACPEKYNTRVKAYRAKNKERVKHYHAELYRESPAKYKAASKAYYAANRDEICARRREKYAARKAAGEAT